MEKGDCAVQDKGKCCSDYYYEKSNRNVVVVSNSGLNSFSSYFTDTDGLWVKGSWGTIPIEDRIYSQDFLQKFNQTLMLTLRDKTLTDTNPGELYLDDSTPYLVHWSRQYGIVKYAYRNATDTLEYERVDLP